ncbi:MAG TPA: MOSC N-terminal beta barrel domain-containing protein [Bryobacteraceae bacterium]|nr:MOSC N-terminal beta barrel domain-containing protein [Bryobacteraceae bacterium]
MIGKVRELRRFPVKSMAAETLESASISWHGFLGDRRWAFVRPGMERSGFPWLTIREKPDLWRYQPYFVDPNDVDASKTMIKTPGGAEFDVVDPDLARELGDGVRVIKEGRGIFDTFPISLLTIQSLAGLSSLVGEALAPLRFRPNIVIDATESAPFPEDQWVGAILRIGGLRCRLDARDKRCVMVNVDPANGASNPAVLRAIATERNARFGVYATVVEPGEASIGAPVILETQVAVPPIGD